MTRPTHPCSPRAGRAGPSRRTIVRLITVLVGLAVLGGCRFEAAPLRVLTYNIHHGEGTDGHLDLPRLAAVIRAQQPDLVALQEVDRGTRRTGDVDQARVLGRLTGMHATYGAAMEYDGGEYGVAVLSRAIPRDADVHSLPYTPGHEPRAALAVRVDTPQGEVRFVATHFAHDTAVDRLAQAERLVELFAEGGSAPVIIAGDLNAEPHEPPLGILLAHWDDAAATDPAATWPSEAPRVRIDYVLPGPAGAWDVIECRALDEAVASDHRPLLAVLARVRRGG